MFYLKLLTTTSLLALFATGCASTAKPTPVKKVENSYLVAKKKSLENEHDFAIEYTPERVILLEPVILKNGSIISKRRITLLPKEPTWTTKEKSISLSPALSAYYNEKRESDVIEYSDELKKYYEFKKMLGAKK